MINDNELRLGNYVYYGESIRQITMLQHSPQRMAIGVDNLITLHERISPIPLSGELLVKCGFHKHNNAWVTEDFDENNYNKDYFTIWDLPEGDYKLNTPMFDIPIHSIHQLQNLYFALTSQELQINIP